MTQGSTAPDADIVFVADGSGDYRTTSAALGQAVGDTGANLRIETFVWSHGYGRVMADHLDHEKHLEEGRRLAALVAAFRQTRPDRAIYLVGHSTGSAVVLAAAEAAPPGSVDLVLLLAPAVSRNYDLRPALRNIRRGIDAFTSRRDIGALGIAMRLGGTADRRRTAASGRVGFTPILNCPGDEGLYAKLRIHPWDSSVEWTGNRGRHYGTIQEGYVRAYLLPLLVRSDSVSASPTR
jgi:pimeloyl-ACP methyl ester carboxylesterase